MSPIPEYYQTFEAELVALCASTLAGFKSGSIFSVRPVNHPYIEEKVTRWDTILSPMGIRMRILCQGNQNCQTIIYVYRPAMAQSDLDDPLAQKILAGFGCLEYDLESVIAHMSQRLREAFDSFPHEIGLLIGYPAEDVDGFIRHKGCNFTCNGLWKAYGCPHQRQKFFSKCRKCERVCTILFSGDTPVEKLAVARRPVF